MLHFLILTAVILPVVILLVVYFKHQKFLRDHKDYVESVPGPKPNLFFGNMLDFAKPTYEFFNTMQKYIDVHGKICKIWEGPCSTLLLVTDEKFLEHIFSSPKFVEKATQYKHLHSWLGTGLLTSTGQKWKKRRRMLTPAFHFAILDNFVEIMESISDIFIEKLDKHIGEASFDVYPYISLYTLDVICEAAMGTSVNAQTNNKSDYVVNIKVLCKIVNNKVLTPLPWFIYPFTWKAFKERKALKVVHDYTDTVIEKKIRQKCNSNNHTEASDDIGQKKKLAFLDLLLESTIDGESLSKSDVREEVDTFMFEGHDTTSSALGFAIYVLSRYPQVQHKVYEEQIEVLGTDRTVRPTITDLNNMKYLELVIKETLRIYPAVPFIGRSVPEDFEWGSYKISKNASLFLLPFLTQRDPEYFPDPLVFNPDRFLSNEGKHPYRYTPFSAGIRNCIGQKFAMLEMQSTISKIVRHFQLFPSTPDEELVLLPETVLMSKNGINISIKRRLPEKNCEK